MSRIRYQPAREFAAANGMDSTSPLSAMQPSYVRTAYNVNLGLYSGYYKRGGYSAVLDTAWGSRDIIAGLEYRDSGSTRRVVLHGTDGSTSRVGYTTGSGVTDIATGLSGTAQGSFVSVGALTFWFNGVDAPLVIDGTASRQLGITAPSNAPTGATATTGSLTQLGTYTYAYTYYNSVTGAESSPSPFYQYTLTGTDDQINLTLTAGSSTTADTIRVWRTVANGNVLFLDGTNDIADTSYSSTVADTGLGRQMDDDNSRLTLFTSVARTPIVADSRIFVVSADNEARWSKKGLYGSMPESFEVKAVADTLSKLGANDKNVGFSAAGEIPVLLKEQSIGRLESIGIPDSASVIDAQIYEYKEIAQGCGAVSHHAAVQVGGKVIYLGRDNVWETDGVQVRPIADLIGTTIRSFSYSTTQAPKYRAGDDSERKRVYFQCFANTSDTDPTWTLVGDYRQKNQAGGINWRWTVYRPGLNTTTHPGIKAACFIEITSSTTGKKDMWFGNTVANGQLYKMNDGNADIDKGIYFELTSRPYDLDVPEQAKLFKTCIVQAQGDGGDYNLQVGAIYDFSSSIESIRQFSLYNAGGRWDEALWDVGVFADESQKKIRYDAHRKADWMQLVIRQTEASAPVTVYGWGVSGSVFGAF